MRVQLTMRGARHTVWRMTPLPTVITVEEVATALQVDPQTVRRWATLGQIDAIRLPGGRWRFRRDVIEDLLYGRAPLPTTTELDAAS